MLSPGLLSGFGYAQLFVELTPYHLGLFPVLPGLPLPPLMKAVPPPNLFPLLLVLPIHFCLCLF